MAGTPSSPDRPMTGCIFAGLVILAIFVLLCVLNERRDKRPSNEELLARVRAGHGYDGSLHELERRGPLAESQAPDMLAAIEQNLDLAPDLIRVLNRADPNWKSRPEAHSLAHKVATLWTEKSTLTPRTRSLLLTISEEMVPGISTLLASLEPEDPRLARELVAVCLNATDPGWAKSDSAKQALPTLALALASSGVLADHQWTAMLKLGEDTLSRIDTDWPKSPAVRSAIPGLVRQYVTKHPYQSEPIGRILGRIDPNWATAAETKEALPTIVSAAVNSSDVRAKALALLDQTEPGWTKQPGSARVTPLLIANLRLGGQESRRRVMEYLDQIDPKWPMRPEAKAVLPSLVACLDFNAHGSHDPRLIDDVFRIIARIGPPTPAEIPELCRLLTETRAPLVVAEATKLLTQLGSSAKSAVARLVGPLATADGEQMDRILSVLWAIDPNWRSTPEAKALTSALTTRWKDVAKKAQGLQWHKELGLQAELIAVAESLSAISPEWAKSEDAKAFVSDLTTILRQTIGASSSPRLVQTLDRIQPTWRTNADIDGMIRTLILWADNGDLTAHQRFVSLLDLIDPRWPESKAAKEAIPKLILHAAKPACLSAREAHNVTLTMLKRIDPNWSRSNDATAVLPELYKQVADSGDYRDYAVSILGMIEPKWRESKQGQAAIGKLVTLVTSGTDYGHPSALDVLDTLEPKWFASREAKDGVVDLIVRLTDPEESKRQIAADLLAKIEPEWSASMAAKAAIPRLITRLDGKAREVHFATVSVLKKIGPPAKEAVPDLIALLRDADPQLKTEIRAAIKAIQGDK